MINFFILLSILFIGVEFYQLFNREKIYRKYENINKSYILFYIFKLLYIIWVFIGFFTANYILYLGIFSLSIFKFLVLYTKKDLLINLYDIIGAVLRVLLLIMITMLVSFQ
jgi:hypothetical protein